MFLIITEIYLFLFRTHVKLQSSNIYIMIATVTIGFIVTVAIVLLNLYVDVVVS